MTQLPRLVEKRWIAIPSANTLEVAGALVSAKQQEHVNVCTGQPDRVYQRDTAI